LIGAHSPAYLGRLTHNNATYLTEKGYTYFFLFLPMQGIMH